MIGLGTIINVAGIIAGGLCGLLFGNRIEERYQNILMSAAGICVVFLGISGAVKEILFIDNGKLASGGTVMMILSLSAGALIGEWMNIEFRMEQFGEWLKKKTKSEEESGFVEFISDRLCHNLLCRGKSGLGKNDKSSRFSSGFGDRRDPCVFDVKFSLLDIT